MAAKFDINNFRAARASSMLPISAIHGVVIGELCSRANIALWKEGIESTDLETQSDAYSHFAGFQRAMISTAADYAKHAEGDDRFVANDLEQALQASNVNKFLSQAHSDATEGDLRRLAAQFLQSSLAAAAKTRQRPSPRP
jgi:hypothetical protein